MIIRHAQPGDEDEIRKLYLAAFDDAENCTVAELACDLLSLDTTIHFVAESENAIVGHIAFSPVAAKSNPDFEGYILAPLAVHPDHQKQRIGSTLVKKGMEEISGSSVVLVYGDPAYYGRFGFDTKSAEKYIPPFSLQFPHGWQATAPGEAEIVCVEPLNQPHLW